MFSILIPTYNYDVTTLVENLSQQLENSELHYELIVCDDCSTNQSIVKNNKYVNSLSNCKLIENTKNLGRTATRQKLAKFATYEWLLFLDADVMPKHDDFIKRFDIENQNADIIFGGVEYDCSQKQKPDRTLSFKYGKKREAQCSGSRKKKPYLSIISGCILIKKQIFLSANIIAENLYASDVVFCWELEKMQAVVSHIDNPVFHLGLEKNANFIDKKLKGLKNLYRFESEKKIPQDYKKIQNAYQKLKKNRIDLIFVKTMKCLEHFILKNLKGKSPSLLLFDLYRLYYFSKLHMNSKPMD